MHFTLVICRPENVEGGSIRFGQLAYVVAFSGGGAKDITSRSDALYQPPLRVQLLTNGYLAG